MMTFLIILLGTTMLYVYATSRIEGYIKVLSLQGLLLFFMIVLDYAERDLFQLIFLSIETLVFKAVVMPLLLINFVRKNEIKRDIEPYIPQFFSLLLSSVLFVFGFLVAYWASTIQPAVEPLSFGISISIVISGLVLIMIRKKIITHILSYIMIENGIFLLSLSVANEMPFIVNLGVLLDIFVGIYMFVIFFNRIQQAYDEDQIDALKSLKD